MNIRTPFHPLEQFPDLLNLSSNWESIRSEILSLDEPVLSIDRVNKSHEAVYHEIKTNGKSGWVKGWNTNGQPNEKWLNFPIRFYDEMLSSIEQKMPFTAKLISPLQGIRVCALNKMLPDIFLGTHSHPDHTSRGTLIYHLCLYAEDQVTPYNFLNVNGEFKHQLPGTSYVFDGSFPHFALNGSSSDRIIMYIEFKADALKKK